MSDSERTAVLLDGAAGVEQVLDGEDGSGVRGVMRELGATRLLAVADIVAGRDLPCERSGADEPRGALHERLGTALWLPLWATPNEALLRSARAWLVANGAGSDAASRRAVALASPILIAGAASVPLPEVVLLSSPGAVRLSGGAPLPIADAATTRLEGDLVLSAPATLSQHLHAVNLRSTVLARVRRDCGERARARDVGLVPASFALAALARARPLRVALPRIAIEAYGRVLVAVKMWELERSSEVAR